MQRRQHTHIGKCNRSSEYGLVAHILIWMVRQYDKCQKDFFFTDIGSFTDIRILPIPLQLFKVRDKHFEKLPWGEGNYEKKLGGGEMK